MVHGRPLLCRLWHLSHPIDKSQLNKSQHHRLRCRLQKQISIMAHQNRQKTACATDIILSLSLSFWSKFHSLLFSVCIWDTWHWTIFIASINTTNIYANESSGRLFATGASVLNRFSSGATMMYGDMQMMLLLLLYILGTTHHPMQCRTMMGWLFISQPDDCSIG